LEIFGDALPESIPPQAEKYHSKTDSRGVQIINRNEH
jgi:hypothetical protein